MTHSHVTEDKVVGREREKKEILRLLVGSESTESTEGELMVIFLLLVLEGLEKPHLPNLYTVMQL